MAITHRDEYVQAIYVIGDHGDDRSKVIATALMEAARVVLAEGLNVQSIEITESDEIVLYCDRGLPPYEPYPPAPVPHGLTEGESARR